MKAGLAVALLLILPLAMVARAPAALLVALPAPASPLRITAAEGTLWHGGVELESPRQTLGHVDWHADWTELRHGAIAFDTRVDSRPAGRVTLGFNGWHLREGKLSLPLAGVADLVPGLARSVAGGRLSVAAPTWQCDWSGVCRGTALLVIEDLAARWLRGISPGRLQMELTGATPPRLMLRNSGGMVALRGEGTIEGWQPHLRLELAPGGGAPEGIARALATLAPADHAGRVTITWPR